jgi:hypothetical protein
VVGNRSLKLKARSRSAVNAWGAGSHPNLNTIGSTDGIEIGMNERPTNSMKKILFIAIACFSLIFSIARADQVYGSMTSEEESRLLAKAQAESRKDIKAYADWCASPIVSGDDSPYDAIKHFIDKDAKSGRSAVEADYQKYKTAHLKSSRNLEYLYGYIYTADQIHKLFYEWPSSDEYYNSSTDIFTVIYQKNVKVPHTFAWARLVFTIIPDREAAGMGERLMALAPNDDEIIYMAASDLAYYSYNQDLAGRQKGIDIAKKQIAKHNNAAAYANLGIVYDNIYFWTHDSKYADLEIEAYNTAIAKQTDQKKIASYKKSIEALRARQAQFEAQKKK